MYNHLLHLISVVGVSSILKQVAITPESVSRARNRWVISELVKLHKQHLDGRLPVYDGRKALFTAGPLPFKAKEFVLMLTNPDRAGQGYHY
jgi:eukaryotic translation initiation factor 2C